jgi:hypothetical protein
VSQPLVVASPQSGGGHYSGGSHDRASYYCSTGRIEPGTSPSGDFLWRNADANPSGFHAGKMAHRQSNIIGWHVWTAVKMRGVPRSRMTERQSDTLLPHGGRERRRQTVKPVSETMHQRRVARCLGQKQRRAGTLFPRRGLFLSLWYKLTPPDEWTVVPQFRYRHEAHAPRRMRLPSGPPCIELFLSHLRVYPVPFAG